MEWEVLATLETGRVRRAGRFVVVELDGPHRVLSTSARTGGEAAGVRLLVNHQSCEGAGHEARAHLMSTKGRSAITSASAPRSAPRPRAPR